MLSKRYESTEVDRRTWLHVPSGTHWSTSSDTHQVVEIQIEIHQILRCIYKVRSFEKVGVFDQPSITKGSSYKKHFNDV